jgi:hypothetical protein
MKSYTLMAILVFAVILVAGVSHAALQSAPQLIYTSEIHYIMSEEPVAFVDVVWSPPQDDPGSKRKRFRESTAGLETAQRPLVSEVVERPVCWRLEFSTGSFGWALVARQLSEIFGRTVGEYSSIRVFDNEPPTPGYRVRYAMYASYVREYYLIKRGDDVAIVSLLVPAHGAAKVCVCMERLAGCTDVPVIVDAPGVCASMGVFPTADNDCSPADNSGGDKRNFRENPTEDRSADAATWGKIKALYEQP